MATAGDWTLEAAAPRGSTVAALDAWVERDDLPAGAAGGTVRWVDADAGRAKVILDTDTLANLSTGRRTIVVGAHRFSDGQRLDYASIGADERQPALSGAAEENAALPGLRAAALRSPDTRRMGGTSVAAAAVTRQVFNALAGGVPAQGVAGHLPSGPWVRRLDQGETG